MWGASGTGKSRETSSIGAVVQNAITQLQNERRTGGNPGNAGRIGKPVLRAGFWPRRSVDQSVAAEQSAAVAR